MMKNEVWLLNTCPACDNPKEKNRAILEVDKKKYPDDSAYCHKCNSVWTVARSTPAQPAVGL